MYVAKVGLDYIGKDGKPKRVEAGESCDDVPKTSVGWLVEQGFIEKTDKDKDGQD